ncbi:DUF2156 domain-containing protein [Proteiniclasticum sp. C24MP]|uniref:DUF2156 domain-containing protein n=1 Tax=Proteiniclasticum sp. C24MP TaxID=3374101 RepID=UPI0037545D67
MNFKPLDMDSKKLFDQFLNPYPFLVSTYNFTNLFIWRNAQNIQYAHTDHALYIMKEKENTYFIPPICKDKTKGKECYDSLLSFMDAKGFEKVLRDVSKSQLEEIRQLGYEFSYESDRDSAEYIYSVESMSSFSGKDLHSKRNHFNNFIRYNQYTIKHIEESKEECLALALKWYEDSNQSDALRHELTGIRTLLEHQEFFNIVGISVFVDDICQGFSLLEVLNEDVILNHIEKADRRISGLYAFLARTSMEYFGAGIRYTNREQDMGIPGLRKSKESYMPEFLEEKFIVTFH